MIGAENGYICLLYTSDAADERSSVDLGGRRIIKKKKQRKLIVGRIHDARDKDLRQKQCDVIPTDGATDIKRIEDQTDTENTNEN